MVSVIIKDWVLLAGICMWMMHVSSVSSENVLVAVSHKAEIENNQVVSIEFERQKRAIIETVVKAGLVYWRGAQALKKLVKGAKLEVEDSTDNWYLKQSDSNEALKDFFSVGPYNVKTIYKTGDKVQISGQVGDRFMLLKAKGDVARLEITRTPGPYTKPGGKTFISYTNSCLECGRRFDKPLP